MNRYFPAGKPVNVISTFGLEEKPSPESMHNVWAQFKSRVVESRDSGSESVGSVDFELRIISQDANEFWNHFYLTHYRADSDYFSDY